MFSLQSLQIFVALGLAASLVACGGGGGDGKDATPSSTPSAVDGEGREMLTWSFDQVEPTVIGQVFLPSPTGRRTQVVNVCVPGSSTCSVQQVPGRVGKALKFGLEPGAIQSYAWLPGGDPVSMCAGRVFDFNPFGTFTANKHFDSRLTVAMWVKLDVVEPNEEYHLFGTQDPDQFGVDGSFHLRLFNGKAVFSLYPNAYSPMPDLVVTSPDALATGSWQHIAVTYFDTHTTMYINGKVVAESDRFDPTLKEQRTTINESCMPYFLGGITTTGFKQDGLVNAEAPKNGKSLTFPGAIDELVFSNRVLSADDIRKLANPI